MDQKETQYAMCAKAIDEHKFIPLTIGTKHYETLAMLQSDFGDDITMLIQKKLCRYFAQGVPFQGIEDKKDRDVITKFLEKRIELLENNGQLAINSSFAGLAKRDAINKLQEIIKTLGEPNKTGTATEAETKATTAITGTTAITKKIRRDTLLEQLWIAMYKVANLEKDELEVDTTLDNIVESIDRAAPDEALRDAANLSRAKGKAKIKSQANSLEKYITDGTTSTTSSTSTDIDKENKKKLIQLLVLFKTTQFLRPSTNTSVDKDFAELSKSIPGIIDNIYFYNRSIIRFYRSKYLKIVEVFDKFFDKTLGRITDLTKYPIDQMIQIVYILFNLAKFLFTDTFSRTYGVFPKNQGLLRLTLPLSTAKLTDLITTYANYISDELNTKKDKNSLESPPDKNSLDYQLINLHTSSGRLTPIIQLINGKQINFNKDILNNKIDALKAIKDADLSKYDTLSAQISKFFDSKDTAIYIVYQETPKDLINNNHILQLNDLQCIMANITNEFAFKEQETLPRSIEMKDDENIQRSLASKAKDILPSLTKDNKFKDFGITVKEPLPLVCSITQMTGTILNATFINKRLKRAKGINS
jgi:hypothetical protein